MSEIDWSKPIEVYSLRDGEAIADAEVIVSDLKGRFPYVIRWTQPSGSPQEYAVMCCPLGTTFTSGYCVRNKKVVRRKWVSLAVTKAGGLVMDSFETKEDADHRRVYRMSTGKYVICDVVEIEWTEE